MYEREIDVARRAAFEAGQVLMRYFRSTDLAVREKGDHGPVTQADLRADALIRKALRAAFPDDTLLTEESPREETSAMRRWIVDPMDGTLEFIRGSEDFCVMIGMTVDTLPALGVIYPPTADRMYEGVVGEGAHRVGSMGSPKASRTRLRVKPIETGESIRLVHSKNHRSRRLAELLERFEFATAFPKGSAGLKCMAILEGDADVYVHPSREIKEWDTCAAEALMLAAGGRMSDGNFDPLAYGKSDPRHARGIVAHRPGLPPELASVIRDVSPRPD